MNDQPLRMEPVAAGQRIEALDVLRGFALLGILLVNFEFFTRPIQAVVMGLDPELVGVDRMVGIATQVFAQGKFYSLFSMLFGMGFAVMLARGVERGGFFMTYLRRILALLGIGLVHALLIWSGDILVSYALFGIVLLLFFRRTPVSRLPKWGLSLMVLPVLFMWLLAWGIASQDGSGAMAESFEQHSVEQAASLDEADRILREGSFSEVNAVRRDDLAFMMSSTPIFGLTIFGYFLIGAWFMRSGVIAESEAHRPFFRRLCGVGLAVGLALSAVATYLMLGENFMLPTLRMAAANTFATAGNLLLCLGYLSTIVLLLGQREWGRRLRWLAPAGRMALTNYLGQSLFWTWMFYGYGLGLYGQVPRWLMPILAVVFFALQVQLSRWWLTRYRFGPAEWLWRSLTYLRAQPMRRVVEESM
ncbi:MAG TPA: DUF418 domain-containing protein [Xanthomonadaceae bacterium]|nr:DUF418 domain-containing protein [Xanthomonadaceae bacterium]